MHVLCISNVQIQIKYLYSTACLYNNSSDGVNLFSCSLFILGIKPPSNAAAWDILLPWVAAGTGSLPSKECRLSKPDASWPSKPDINLLMASSVSAAFGLPSKKSPSSGQGLPWSWSASAVDGAVKARCSLSRCLPRNPVVIQVKSVYTYICIDCTVYSIVYTIP